MPPPTTVAATAIPGPAPGLARATRLALVFPLLALLLFAGLVALDVSGSSIAMFGATGADRSVDVVAGTPRAIRSDEWRITTPLSVQAKEMGFPKEPWIGMTQTDVETTSNVGPGWDWAELAKPQDWGYFLFGASRGLAWHWWFSFLVCLAAVYGLVFALTRSIPLSIAAALLVAFSPYTAWWSSPSTALLLGFGAATALGFVHAFGADGWRRASWSVLGGYSAVALVFIVYPPWMISIAWIVVGTCCGYLADHWRGKRAALLAVGPGGAVAAAALGAWFFVNQSAIAAAAGTIYPGHRIAEAGSRTVQWLMSAPASFWLATTSEKLGPPTNESEISVSWLPLPVVVVGAVAALAVAFRLRARRPVPATPGPIAASCGSREPLGWGIDRDVLANDSVGRAGGFWTLVGTIAATALVFAWAVLPVPAVIGRATLLDRVPPVRTPAALGLGCCIILVVSAATLRRCYTPRWLKLVAAASAVVTAGLAVWAVGSIPIDQSIFNPLLLASSGLILAAAVAWLIFARIAVPAVIAIGVYTFTAWVLVNPLMHGLGPLESDPLVVTTKEYVARHPNARFATVGAAPPDTITLDALVRAGGATSLGGAYYYPDRQIMEALAPGQERIWNNYVNFYWLPDATARPVRLEEVALTVVNMHVDLCDPKVQGLLGITVVVSTEDLSSLPCATLERNIKRGKHVLYRYELRGNSTDRLGSQP